MEGGRLYPAIRVVGPRKLAVIDFTKQLAEASGFLTVLEYRDKGASKKNGGTRNWGDASGEGSHIGSDVEGDARTGSETTSSGGGGGGTSSSDSHR